jgi:hypothetical protein
MLRKRLILASGLNRVLAPLILAALILPCGVAAPALAGSLFGAKPPPEDAPDPNALTQEFISPMGEPFRGHRVDPYPVAAWFKGADANGDGVVTIEEFRADAMRFFKALDKDADGVLDEKEITAYEDQMVPEIKAAMGRDPTAIATHEYADTTRGYGDEAPVNYIEDASRVGDARQRDAGKDAKIERLAPRRGAGVFSFFDEPEPVRADDTNIDFRVSLREWMAAADRRFHQLDLKHDGKLTLDEMPQTPYQRAMLRRK